MCAPYIRVAVARLHEFANEYELRGNKMHLSIQAS